MLFAIDEANAFFGDSLYKVDFKPVTPFLHCSSPFLTLAAAAGD